MAKNISIETVLIQVRGRLQEEGIKLWLEPYHVTAIGPVEPELEKLSRNLCQVLNVPYDYCLAAISELQNNALDKLQARQEFTVSGLATIKVRVPNTESGARLLTLQTKLNVLAEELHEQIAEKLGITASRVKLISAGTVIRRESTLDSQNIQNNQQVLAISIETTPTEANAEDAMYDKLQRAKEDATTLLKRENSYMEMEDQDGNPIHLPPEEKRALMMALAMNEKGRAALKRENYNEALIFLLEADQEYKTCNSQLLEAVDNYALLNLDIVWCYLMLHSVSHLPDAEKRLSICEQNFKRSYGNNMDRVVSLKGTAVNEKALIMRLHILQAVLQFHQNNRTEALRLLCLAEIELVQLQVDENSVTMLTEMGFSNAEARIGLRATSNNIEQAISFIEDKRKQRKDARKIGAAQHKIKSSLFTMDNDKWINPKNLYSLVEMGFEKNLCALALKKSDNDINQAISLLQTNYAVLENELINEIAPNKSLREQMILMGFPAQIVDLALKNITNESMDSAIEELMRLQSDGTYDQMLDTLLDTMDAVAGTSNNSNDPSTSFRKQMKNEKDAYKRFTEDVDTEDDDYLDLPLTQERQLISQYKNLVDI